MPAGDRRVVAVTGAFGSFGRRVLRLLEQDDDVDKVVALDVRDATRLASRDGEETTDPAAFLRAHPKLSAHTLDLTEAGADRELSTVLKSERAGSLVHLAFLSTPTHEVEMAHELETIGTLYCLRAAADARLSSLVSLSSAMCYGARADNPGWITERQPLRPGDARSLRDKAEADDAVRKFADEHKDVAAAVARVGAVVDGAADHFWTRTFARPVVPAVLGYDPLLQLMLTDDAALGVHMLWKARARGPQNIVGRGVLPLSHVLTRLGRAPLYLPAGIGASVVGALWSAQLVDMPKAYLDYLRWPWVCDGETARREAGFSAPHDVGATLAALTGRAPPVAAAAAERAP